MNLKVGKITTEFSGFYEPACNTVQPFILPRVLAPSRLWAGNCRHSTRVYLSIHMKHVASTGDGTHNIPSHVLVANTGDCDQTAGDHR